jgi:ABC-2 type transport system ATP-binding protein
MRDAIQAAGLVKTYPGDVRALDGIDFSVRAGTVFGMLGPNGAGKSTTVKILTTLSRPDEGSATVAGFDVLRRPNDVRRAIGVVGQKAGVDREATGRENLRLQGQLFGMGGKELERRASELLDRFGLSESQHRIVKTYSGGMQRRLDIALGLIHEPQVLFLDEPTTGLDPEVRAGMWQEITALAERGLTIFLTTHYLEEADALTQRLVIVDRGKIVAQGTADELKGELKGDTISVELANPETDGRVRTALDRVIEIRDVTVDGHALRARSDDGARAVPVVLQALEAGGVSVASVTVSRPSLDDVYLRHTGRSFTQAESQAAAEEQERQRQEARR